MKKKPIYTPLVIVRKMVYISIAVLCLYCVYKMAALHVYTEKYASFSSYITYGSASETMSDEFMLCAIDGLPSDSPIKLTQVSYYPKQQQLVFGLVTLRNQTHDSYIMIKKDADNVGVLSTGMSKKFLLKEIRQAWYELDHPLLFGEKYQIEFYVQDECICNGEIVFLKDK